MQFSKDDTQKVKGLAIIFMFIHHCFLDPSRYTGKEINFFPFSEGLVNNVALSMKICVAMFVFLSAYGMTLSFKKVNNHFDCTKKEISNLILKRYIKMMGGFMFVFIFLQLYSLVAGMEWYTHVYGTGIMSVLYAVIDLFGMAQIFHTPTFIATFWYMSLAQIIIFILPVMIWIYKRFSGYILISIAIMISILFPVTTADASKPNTYAFFTVYVVCIALGIIAADHQTFTALKSYNPLKQVPFIGKLIKFIIYIAVIILLVYFRHHTRSTALLPVWEALIPLIVIGFCFEFIDHIPVISSILNLLGKYSMDMFLIHNFIRIAWYYDFTYSFKYAILVVFVLLIITLAVSIILELIKKLIRFDYLINLVQRKLNLS